MNTFGFFLRTAWHHLTRGGQRIFVALLCVAFGVMSLVALMLVSQSFERAVVLEPSEQIGADISLVRQSEDTISPEQVEELKALQASGEIERFTLMAYTSSLTLRRLDSGELIFVAAGMGIEPGVYPLAGTLALSEPGNVGASTLLQEPGDVLITRDIAEENNLHVGDRIVLADLHAGAPVAGHIRGIASDTPNHQGSKIYYTLETAQRLATGQPAINLALAMAADPAAVAEKLGASGWSVTTAAWLAGNNRDAQDLFALLLKGAGIMGLLVGGIGVANTMQVLLRRRLKEVAIWKALGYRERHLQALFALEAALLGTLGSLLGAGLGLAVSSGLLRLFSRTGNLLVSWSFSPFPILTGVLVGILTTVIFAMAAIVLTSRAQPLALLRNEPVDVGRLPWQKSAGLALILALPFTAVTSLVMGSLLEGAGVLLFALVGLALLGGLFAGSVWAVSHLLPLGRLPLARMAQKSLRRRGLSLIFAMIALFTGNVALAMSVVVTQNARSVMDERTVRVEGYNLQIIAPASQEGEVRRALEAQKIEKFATGSLTQVKGIRAPVSGEAPSIQLVLVGRSEPGEYLVEGAPWGSQPEGVYAPQYAGVLAGSQVKVTFRDGSTRALNVVGTYEVDWSVERLPPSTGLLMAESLSASLAKPDTVHFFIQAPPGRLHSTSAALGRALPGATVIDLQAYAARYTLQIHNLFVLAVAMAGLALLAGVLLVANSVSLAMLDRRYEIGVLKVVGYSQTHILVSLGVEYGLVALIASAAGLVVVQVFFMVLALVNGLAGGLLALAPGSAALIGMLGVGLVLLAVLAVTWGPVRVSPAVVLNENT